MENITEKEEVKKAIVELVVQEGTLIETVVAKSHLVDTQKSHTPLNG